MPPKTPLGHYLRLMDASRRAAGRRLDTLGWRPLPTSSRGIFATDTVVLRQYGDVDPQAPVVLLVPAPIKKPYIWDLAPAASVVRQLLQAGFNVYLTDWQEPGPGQGGLGLGAYADRLIEQCMTAIENATGASGAFLIGHSLGGLQAAIYTALHPDRVQGLVLLEAPIVFEHDSGPVKALLDALQPVRLLGGSEDTVAGISMNSLSVLAAPEVFLGERLRDFWQCQGNPEAFFRHMLVERWTLDETALPKRLLQEVSEDLYRKNLFYRGELRVNGKPALPCQVVAPLLAVACPQSHFIPPKTMLRFLEATSSSERQMLDYQGDVGVALQHVGVLVGNHAHALLWPKIIHWLQAHAPGRRQANARQGPISADAEPCPAVRRGSPRES